MNVAALIFLIVSAGALLALPRKWAPIPLLASCCYMTIGQGIEIGPISLPIYRIVLAVGLVRVVVRREGLIGGINTIDRLMIAFAGWIILASFFHERVPGAGPIYASGLVFNILLVYFLTRVWCAGVTELNAVLRMVAWLLVPVALSMLAEHIYQRNLFGVLFGGVPEGVYIRGGVIRAQGPFAHPILAGTVGAVCVPLMIGIWRTHRISAAVGISAGVAMVIASTSSGPLMSLFMGVFALLLWLYRPVVRIVRWAVVMLYMAAEVLMTRPAYYLISKIDLTGSSTGWHRSRLIQVAIENISDWWLFGTDYTGDWMAHTVDEAGRHADITNYYIWIGVIGGLPAMLLLIAIIWRAFSWVGKCVQDITGHPQKHFFLIWCLGAGLFAHACTSLSVAYTDQSMMFFWLNVGGISSVYSVVVLGVGASERVSGSAPVDGRPVISSKRRRTTPRPGSGSVRRPLRTRMNRQYK